MRQIHKLEPPRAFTSFVKHQTPQQWSELSHDNKNLYEQCVAALSAEQFGLSGYTEEVIDAKRCHIDHFRKRSLFKSPHQIFDWSNLILDNHSRLYGAYAKDNGANRATKIEDYALIINPVTENPQHFFTYQENGNIIPRHHLTPQERERAMRTIELFNLNHSALVQQRCGLIQMLRAAIESGGYNTDEIYECFNCAGFTSVIDNFMR